MIALYGAMLFMPEVFDIPYRIPIGIAMTALIVLGVYETVIAKITITSDSIRLKTLLTDKTLKLNQIKGFYAARSLTGKVNRIQIMPKNSTDKSIKIPNVSLIGKRGELVQWLDNNFTDLGK